MMRLGATFREAKAACLGLEMVIWGQLRLGGQLPLGGRNTQCLLPYAELSTKKGIIIGVSL